MKKFTLLSLIFISIIFSSCTFTEDIYINDDGTGKFTMDMDGSSLMAMIPKDSGKVQKNIDSTFTFKELFELKKDSIAKLPQEEQDRLKKLENFKMKIKMNFDEKQFLFNMNTDFKNVNELQDMMSTMNGVQSINPTSKNKEAALATEGFGSNNSTLKYYYDGKKFTRNAVMNKNLKTNAKSDSLKSSYEMIYKSSNYILRYHFPKKVKKISNEKASFSEDRKTITIEYPFDEYMNNPEKLNFEIDFEK